MSVPLQIVVAAADNDVIGADGGMPWRLATDLQRFKTLTLGTPMIMGRKTFESIGKPLPGRSSIVVTRDESWMVDGAIVVTSIEKALELAQEIAAAEGARAVSIVGGGEIYRQTMADCAIIHMTRVHLAPEGDTWFPPIEPERWAVESEERFPRTEKDSAETTYRIYRRFK